MEEDIFDSGYKYIKGLQDIFASMKGYRCTTCLSFRDCIHASKNDLEEISTIIEKDGEEIDVVDYDTSKLSDEDKVLVFDNLAKTWELTKTETTAEYAVFGGFVSEDGIAIPVENPFTAAFLAMKIKNNIGKYSPHKEAIVVAKKIVEHDEGFDMEMGIMRYSRLRALLYAKALLTVAIEYVEDGVEEVEDPDKVCESLSDALDSVDERIDSYCEQYPEDADFVDDMLEEILPDLECDDDDDDDDE